MSSSWIHQTDEAIQRLSISFVLIVVTAFCFGTRSIWLVWRRQKNRAAASCENCPSYLPWDITGWQFSRQMTRAEKIGSVNSFIRQCYETVESKTFTGIRAGRRAYFTIDPRVCQAVLATSFDDFGVEPFRAPTRDAFIGRGVLTTDGAFWKRSRDGLKAVFERAQISNLGLLRKHVDKLIEHIPSGGATIDLQPLIVRFFLDISSEILLGESANSLDPGRSTIDAALFIESFNQALAGVSKRLSRGRYNKFYELFTKDEEWLRSCNDTKELVDGYVNRALDGKAGGDEEETFSFIRILAQDNDDRGYIRDQVVNAFFPARNSSNRGLNHIIFLLARNPAAWSKLREEALLQDAEALTYESIKQMRYVKWVINEGLRLYAPSPRTVRVALRDTILPHGGGRFGDHPIEVEKGSMIIMDTACMHRDKEFWGLDAEQFRPSRWQHVHPKWEYIPFAGGPRICPAQNMMLTQYAYVLIKLAQRFTRVENKDPEERFIETWSGIGVSSRNGVNVAFFA